PGYPAFLHGQLQPARLRKVHIPQLSNHNRQAIAFKGFLGSPQHIPLTSHLHENDTVWLYTEGNQGRWKKHPRRTDPEANAAAGHQLAQQAAHETTGSRAFFPAPANKLVHTEGRESAVRKGLLHRAETNPCGRAIRRDNSLQAQDILLQSIYYLTCIFTCRHHILTKWDTKANTNIFSNQVLSLAMK